MDCSSLVWDYRAGVLPDSLVFFVFLFAVSLGIDVDELRVNWHLPDTKCNKKRALFWNLLNVFQE
jgi:hypothetical protein